MRASPLINAFVTLAGAQGSYCLAQTSGNNNNDEENEIKKIWLWTNKKTRQKQVGFINSCLKNIRSLAGFLSLVNVLGQVVLFSFPLLVILPSAACNMNYQPLSCHYLAVSCFLSSGRARSSWTSHPSCTITQQRKVHARVRVLLDLKVVALKPLHHVIFNTVCQRWNWVIHTQGRLKTKPERSSLKPLIHHWTASYWVGPEFMSKYETGYVGKMALKKMNVILCICIKWRWSCFQIAVDRRSFYSVLLQAGDDKYIPDVIFMIKCWNFHYSVIQSTSLSVSKFFALRSDFTACFLTFPSGCARSNWTKHSMEALCEDFRVTFFFYISVLPLQFKVFQHWWMRHIQTGGFHPPV